MATTILPAAAALGELVPPPLQLEHLARQRRFSRPGRPHKKHRLARRHGDVLDLLDHAVERGVACGNAVFEERQRLALFLGEARCDPVVAGKVQVSMMEYFPFSAMCRG